MQNDLYHSDENENAALPVGLLLKSSSSFVPSFQAISSSPLQSHIEAADERMRLIHFLKQLGLSDCWIAQINQRAITLAFELNGNATSLYLEKIFVVNEAMQRVEVRFDDYQHWKIAQNRSFSPIDRVFTPIESKSGWMSTDASEQLFDLITAFENTRVRDYLLGSIQTKLAACIRNLSELQTMQPDLFEAVKQNYLQKLDRYDTMNAFIIKLYTVLNELESEGFFVDNNRIKRALK